MVCGVIDRASAARRGLLVIFATDGALFASWASRLPQVQDNIHAGAADLGFALAGTAVGALSAMPITGVVCHHRAPYRVACVTLLALCLSMVLPATADSPLSLGLALLVFGACYGATDVAMNSAAVQLSAVIDRPIVPQFHSAYSLGALGGAGVGAAAAGIGLAVWIHLLLMGAAAVIALMSSSARLFFSTVAPIPAPEPIRPAAVSDQKRRPGGRTWPALLVAATLTTGTALAEGVTASWSGIYLVDEAGAALWVAPLGFAIMSMVMAILRGFGTRLLERFGTRLVACAGALIAAAGLFLALIAIVPVVLLGYGVAGAGVGCLFPIGIAQAGAAKGSIGVSLASSLGYAGFLVGPPVIGVTAQQVGLPTALALVAATLVGVFAAASRLPNDRRGKLGNIAE
jgi:MFS family permease